MAAGSSVWSSRFSASRLMANCASDTRQGSLAGVAEPASGSTSSGSVAASTGCTLIVPFASRSRLMTPSSSVNPAAETVFSGHRISPPHKRTSGSLSTSVSSPARPSASLKVRTTRSLNDISKLLTLASSVPSGRVSTR